MRRNSLAAIVALALLFLTACTSSNGTTVTVLGYTVVIKTAPPTTAQVGTSIPIAFTVTENESDGTSKSASGKSFTVTVTAGGGTINGAASATLTTGADGSASLTWLLGSTVGTQTVRGSVSSDKFLDVSVTATVPPVSSVVVTLATPSITLGTTGDQATAVLKDASGNVLQGRTVTWQSSSVAVATVSVTGVITTVGVGTSTITATSEGQSGGALLTVTAVPVSTVTTTIAAPSITLGTVGDQATAVTKDASGNVLLGRTVTWQSSATTVATVNATGVITTVGVGTSTITATSEGQSGGALLTVTPVPVSTVTTTIATPSITLGTVGDQATAVTKDASGNVLLGRTVTWQSSNIAVATVSATGVITTVAVGTSTITATSEGQSGPALLIVIQSTWNAAWHLRQQITVTTTTASAPVGYSVAVQLNHAALVTAGKAIVSGNDVRVLYWTGTAWVELDRVLDAGSLWNSATTTIWFKTQAAINAASADNNYYVYYSNAAAPAPPANSTNVFLFADDFESGNLSKWTQLGLWTIDNTRSHAGTVALRYPAEGSAVATLVANPALNVDNVYLDAWWYRDTPSTGYDIAQAVRETGGLNGYGTRLYLLPPFGLTVEKSVGGIPTTVAAPAGAAPAAGTWNRVGTAMFGSTFYLLVNGALQTTASGQTELASGNVGFGKIIVPPGASWWLDDVVARKYINPEPTSALGAEGAAP